MGTIVQIILALPQIIKAFAALWSFAREVQEKKKQADLDQLKEDIKNAKTEDDFRNAARKLRPPGV